MPLMPSRVYRHWSGENPRSMESVEFTLLLFAGLARFSDAMAETLGLMEIRR